MAFSPDGMFYLGKEDLEPTIGSAGTGIRSVLGLQNKKEAVDSILESGNFDTPESRRAVLEQIRAVDSEAYYKYADLNQKYESKELDLKSKFGSPALKRAWRDTEGPRASVTWATEHLQAHGVSSEDLSRLTTIGAITNKIIQLAKDGKIEKGAAGKLIEAYKFQMKDDKKYYMALNEFNPPGSFKSNQTRDINSIKGRSSYTTTPTDTPTATATDTVSKIETPSGTGGVYRKYMRKQPVSVPDVLTPKKSTRRGYR